MNTYIYMNDIEKNLDLRNFINLKVKTSLKRFKYLIKTIEVRISDENGPKGGDDKSCMIYIKTDLFPEIIISGVNADTHAVVSRTILRAKRTLARRVKQIRTHEKTPLIAELAY